MAYAGQTKAADKMTRRGKQLVVIIKEQDGLYTVGCREGILHSKFTSADLDRIDHDFMTVNDVPEVLVS